MIIHSIYFVSEITVEKDAEQVDIIIPLGTNQLQYNFCKSYNMLYILQPLISDTGTVK